MKVLFKCILAVFAGWFFSGMLYQVFNDASIATGLYLSALIVFCTERIIKHINKLEAGKSIHKEL